MMGILIDAGKLIDTIWKRHEEVEDKYDLCVDELKGIYCDVVSVIDAQPTAYDVNKVLEQFEDATAIGADCVGNAFECIPKYMAIEIVKAGGIDGNT